MRYYFDDAVLDLAHDIRKAQDVESEQETAIYEIWAFCTDPMETLGNLSTVPDNKMRERVELEKAQYEKLRERMKKIADRCEKRLEEFASAGIWIANESAYKVVAKTLRHLAKMDEMDKWYID